MSNKARFILCFVFVIVLVVTSILTFLYFRASKTTLSSLLLPKQVLLESDVPGVSLNWQNKEGFDIFLDKLGFWQKNAITNLDTGEKFTATKLVIKITNNVQEPFYNMKGENDILWDSLGIKIENTGVITVSVYRKDWGESGVNSGVANVIWKHTKNIIGSSDINIFRGSSVYYKNELFIKVVKTK